MIRLTERAAAGLREILQESGAPRELGVKLVPNQKGGVGMVIDRPAEGDEVVDGGNRPLLIVDAALTAKLDGVVVEVSDAPSPEPGPQFVLRRPDLPRSS